MRRWEVDEAALRTPQRSGLPSCLYVPIAARNEEAIVRYVGDIEKVLTRATPSRAMRVVARRPPDIDYRYPIWDLEESSIFYKTLQVWVHVNYRGYRTAYQRALPEEDLVGQVLDHVLNRRVARLKGFDFIRLVPISREANSSSGLSEQWSVDHHSTARMKTFNMASSAAVQYADLADLVKMLGRKTGGGVMDPVNDAQRLVDLPKEV